jgi:hypothetical protein
MIQAKRIIFFCKKEFQKIIIGFFKEWKIIPIPLNETLREYIL